MIYNIIIIYSQSEITGELAIQTIAVHLDDVDLDFGFDSIPQP